ncbi:MAG TPA: ABC transporter permease [Anaerolineae bacterium]|nr:ABC transporter permease [Anaerolineae bacterium]
MKTGSSRQRTLIRIGQKVLSLHALFSYLFLYLPIIILIIFSFNNSKSVFRWAGFTTHWYLDLFSDPRIMSALKNSLIVASASTIASTIFGTMVSIAMERYDFFGKLPFDALLYLPIVIPDITMAVMLLVFFVTIHMPLGLHTIIISHIAFNISFVSVTVRARLASLDPALEEAAQDLYANEWQTFWKVTFPLLLPGIIGGALMAFTLSLDDYVITFFTAGARSTTLPLRIYSMVKTGVKPDINALSSLMMMVSMALVVLSLLLQRKGGEGVTIQ